MPFGSPPAARRRVAARANWAGFGNPGAGPRQVCNITLIKFNGHDLTIFGESPPMRALGPAPHADAQAAAHAAQVAASFGVGPQATGTVAVPADGPYLGLGTVNIDGFDGSPGGVYSVMYSAPDWSPAAKRHRIDAPAPSWPVCHYREHF